MVTCKICGKRGLFLRVDRNGVCDACNFKQILKEGIFDPSMKLSLPSQPGKQDDTIKPSQSVPLSHFNNADTTISQKIHHFNIFDTTFSVTTTYSSYSVEIRQKTKGILPCLSRESWAGYVSPSGGFVNFGTFQVIGINPATKRKNKRIYQEISEKYAIQRAEIDGLIEPFEVTVLPSKAPSERQLAYANDLGAILPAGACRLDVSAIISRITDDDEAAVNEKISEQAHIYGVKFSLYSGKKAIINLAELLPPKDYSEFIKSIKIK